MVNLITRNGLVWRLYGVSVESDAFYGDFMVKLGVKIVWAFNEGNSVNQNSRQSPY